MKGPEGARSSTRPELVLHLPSVFLLSWLCRSSASSVKLEDHEPDFDHIGDRKVESESLEPELDGLVEGGGESSESESSIHKRGRRLPEFVRIRLSKGGFWVRTEGSSVIWLDWPYGWMISSQRLTNGCFF